MRLYRAPSCDQRERNREPSQELPFSGPDNDAPSLETPPRTKPAMPLSTATAPFVSLPAKARTTTAKTQNTTVAMRTVSLHASFPQSVTLLQLRFASLTAVSLREDFHLQDRAHAGRTRVQIVAAHDLTLVVRPHLVSRRTRFSAFHP